MGGLVCTYASCVSYRRVGSVDANKKGERCEQERENKVLVDCAVHVPRGPSYPQQQVVRGIRVYTGRERKEEKVQSLQYSFP